MTGEALADWTHGVPRFVVISCARCGNRWYLPKEHCPVCGAGEVTRSPARGRGLCVALTRLHLTSADRPHGDDPLRLVLVELDEGPLVMGRAHDDTLAPGHRVRVSFLPDGDAPGRSGGQQDAPALMPSFAREDPA
ncbi:MAG: hypothetical protein JWR45_270 [Blastococcus sp.]|jgi:uncharacterized OB-fold protein|nr:hypothetical protein [Blastococcus sp.]